MATTRSGLKVAEVASRLDVSESTVYAMIRDGRLVAIRPSGAPRGWIRIPEAEVDRHLAETGQITLPLAEISSAA